MSQGKGKGKEATAKSQAFSRESGGSDDASAFGKLPALVGYPRFLALDRITANPNRMRGLSCIRDTRISVSAVLGQLAAGANVDEVLADYPYLERDDVLAALEYAATEAQERELQ